MANIKISALPSLPTQTIALNQSAILPIVQSGTTYNTSLSNIISAFSGRNGNAIYENSNTITSSVTITTGNNAMSAGPLTISDGVVVTIPSGSYWYIF